MRTLSLTAISAALALAAACCDPGTVTPPDPCKDVQCVYGECQEGKCVCNTSVYGSDCSFDATQFYAYGEICDGNSITVSYKAATPEGTRKAEFDPGTFSTCALVILGDASGYNVPIPATGTLLPKARGIEVLLLDKEEPLKNGQFNTLTPQKPYRLTFGEDRATVIYVDPETEQTSYVPFEITAEGSMATLDHASPFYLVNNAPVAAAEAVADGSSVQIDFTGTTDEGFSSAYFMTYQVWEGATKIREWTGTLTGSLPALDGGSHSLVLRAVDPYGEESEVTKSVVIDLCQDAATRCEPWQTCRVIDGVCIGDDPCDPTPCAHGTCNNSSGSAVCTDCGNWTGTTCNTCPTGFWINGQSDCVTDLCYGVTCSGHGSCPDHDGVCQCNAGFDPAEDCSSCSSGFFGYPNCRDDKCDPDPCNGHSTSCDQDTGACTCATGYDAASDCGACANGYGNYPTCAPVPTCSDIVIDCSIDSGFCVAGNNDYPASFTSTDATSFTITVTKLSGCGDIPGWATPNNGAVSGQPTDFTYTTGGCTFQVDTITVQVFGPGGTGECHKDQNLD